VAGGKVLEVGLAPDVVEDESGKEEEAEEERREDDDDDVLHLDLLLEVLVVVVGVGVDVGVVVGRVAVDGVVVDVLVVGWGVGRRHEDGVVELKNESLFCNSSYPGPDPIDLNLSVDYAMVYGV